MQNLPSLAFVLGRFDCFRYLREANPFADWGTIPGKRAKRFASSTGPVSRLCLSITLPRPRPSQERRVGVGLLGSSITYGLHPFHTLFCPRQLVNRRSIFQSTKPPLAPSVGFRWLPVTPFSPFALFTLFSPCCPFTPTARPALCRAFSQRTRLSKSERPTPASADAEHERKYTIQSRFCQAPALKTRRNSIPAQGFADPFFPTVDQSGMLQHSTSSTLSSAGSPRCGRAVITSARNETRPHFPPPRLSTWKTIPRGHSCSAGHGMA